MALNDYRPSKFPPSPKSLVAIGILAVLANLVLGVVVLGGAIWFVVWLLRALKVIP